MKICLISFDFWDYDQHIVRELQTRGIEAHHIKIGNFRHKNLTDRLINTFSKVFLKKNIKYEKRQELVKNTLRQLGHQDKILIINPETLHPSTIKFAKENCSELITYLYDNLERCPAQNLLHFFDKIYSFDHQDVSKHGFLKITNYNYLGHLPQEAQHPTLGLYYITSFDKTRNSILKPLAEKLSEMGIRSKIVIVGKRTWKLQLKALFSKTPEYISLQIRRKPCPVTEVIEEYKNAAVLLDLMRNGQTGLSFRIFEAMALEKKIITDNPEIKNYDFYDPRNILVIEKDFSNLTPEFFKTPYAKLPAEVYEKYTLGHWVEHLFGISKKTVNINHE